MIINYKSLFYNCIFLRGGFNLFCLVFISGEPGGLLPPPLPRKVYILPPEKCMTLLLLHYFASMAYLLENFSSPPGIRGLK